MAKPYKIGEFILESKLGAGGMGVVFRARQVSLQRWVALKLLSRPASAGSKFVQRFYREARATAQLVHPNIIQTYTIGEHKGAPYFAMEYVEGKDLATLLETGDALSVDEAVELVRSVAKALGVASEHSIVHRDIKPANIMVSKAGLVKVMDFGLAKATALDESLTQDGQIIGTPTYMSPEQGTGNEVDTRSDMYSLGCVFYESLTGQPPFRADNVPALVFKQLYENPDPPSKLNADVSKDMDAICMKMMSKDPSDRYQDPHDLLIALASLPTNASMAELNLAKRAKAKDLEDDASGSTMGMPTRVDAPAGSKESSRRESDAPQTLVESPPSAPPKAEKPRGDVTPVRTLIEKPSAPAPKPKTPPKKKDSTAEKTLVETPPAPRPEAPPKRDSSAEKTLIEAAPAPALKPKAPPKRDSAAERTLIEEPPAPKKPAAKAQPANKTPVAGMPAVPKKPPSERTVRKAPVSPGKPVGPLPDPDRPAVVHGTPQSVRYARTVIQDAPELEPPPSKAKTEPKAEAAKKGSQKAVAAGASVTAKVPPPPAGKRVPSSKPSSTSGSSGRLQTERRTTLIGTQYIHTPFALEKVEGVSPYFQKHSSGRWVYDASKGHCRHSEGLAAEELPGMDLEVGSFGDCLVCANWSRRSGCAIAMTQDIANKSRARGADLTEELAVVWCAAKRFDRAIALVESHIRENPDDPGGYQVLARIYERPDYSGTDRKRAIILYGRFLDLAEKHGGYTALELQRARERMENMKSGRITIRADSGPFILQPITNTVDTFRAFYRRDRASYFALCAVTKNKLLIARVGDVDPDTGTPVSDVKALYQRTSRLFRRMKSTAAKKAERDTATRELRRLATMSLEELEEDKQTSNKLEIDDVTEVIYSPAEANDDAEENAFHQISVRTVKTTHEFYFPRSASMDAERCAVVLKRLTGK